MITPRHVLSHDKRNHYWTYHDASLPVVVMIHGFRGTHHGFDLIAKQLPQYHLIIPDLPGFGQSQAFTGSHDLENYVQWLQKFIEGLSLSQPPLLVGHSFGSIVVSAYTAVYPATVSKLILINPISSQRSRGPKAVLLGLTHLYYWLAKKLPITLASYWLSSKVLVTLMTIAMTKTKDAQVRQFIHRQHFQHFSSFASRDSLLDSFAISSHHSVEQAAGSIVVPTLLIAGERDDITPLSEQQKLVLGFFNATLEVIPDVGHLTHYETPAQVARLIHTFAKSK